MTRMIDFAVFHIASWKDGAFPKARPGNTVVKYDQTNRAYDVDADDMAAFIEWVAQNWESDNQPRGFWDDATETMTDEAAQDYLDRIGVSIRAA